MDLSYNHDLYEKEQDYITYELKVAYSHLGNVCLKASAHGPDQYMEELTQVADTITFLSYHAVSLPVKEPGIEIPHDKYLISAVPHEYMYVQ
ncbi:hypothetical protein KW805_00805 [Candidatus Pacearchaeota archaeon]|nr:hypothetical protein [Candidatus Pacearchaeota archaeon]